jgi:2-keto-4-pentenoate hydratase/2-oxohepta-3-ene-1,7-dioic acid hydratase in catechol pathway
MKLLRWAPPGRKSQRRLMRSGSRDLSGLVPEIAGPILSDAGLAMLRGIGAANLPQVTDDARLGPCVGNTGKLICIGLNYSDHAAETGAEVPTEPITFLEATSALCGPECLRVSGLASSRRAI